MQACNCGLIKEGEWQPPLWNRSLGYRFVMSACSRQLVGASSKLKWIAGGPPSAARCFMCQGLATHAGRHVWAGCSPYAWQPWTCGKSAHMLAHGFVGAGKRSGVSAGRLLEWTAGGLGLATRTWRCGACQMALPPACETQSISVWRTKKRVLGRLCVFMGKFL